MTEQIPMKTVSELKFPLLSFSPLATSSPKFSKVNVTKRDVSFESSTESDSSGNITSQAVAGVDESHLDSLKIFDESNSSIHTAIEYVGPERLLHRKFPTILTRVELRNAIYKYKMTEENCEPEEADFYSIVITERILWTACRTWAGTIPVATKDLIDIYVENACENWYMRHTAQLCMDEMKHINEWFKFDRASIVPYCYGKGMPTVVIERLFANKLVRQSTGNCLDIVDVCRMLFAMVGTDECQSFEYWFRVLDIESTGVLHRSDLSNFYKEISRFLAERNVTALPFDNVITQYCDILGTSVWSLKVFKKNQHLAGRIINGFVNAYRFLEQELEEKTNGERVDDENFGAGRRTRWQRMIDHEYDSFYRPGSTLSSSDNSTLAEN